jgi:hypothetical protein
MFVRTIWVVFSQKPPKEEYQGLVQRVTANAVLDQVHGLARLRREFLEHQLPDVLESKVHPRGVPVLPVDVLGVRVDDVEHVRRDVRHPVAVVAVDVALHEIADHEPDVIA